MTARMQQHVHSPTAAAGSSLSTISSSTAPYLGSSLPPYLLPVPQAQQLSWGSCPPVSSGAGPHDGGMQQHVHSPTVAAGSSLSTVSTSSSSGPGLAAAQQQPLPHIADHLPIRSQGTSSLLGQQGRRGGGGRG